MPEAPPPPLPEAASRPVRHRLVCYLSGFDPQGAPHYHRLYTTEAARQAQVSGYTLEVGPRRKAGPLVAWWEVTGRFAKDTAAAPEEVRTRYEFLRWDDIVRSHWPRGVAGLLGRILWASLHMWLNGVMWRMLKTSWPRFLLIALPGLLLVLLALLGLGLGVAGVALARQGGAGWAGLLLPLLGWPGLAYLALQADKHSYVSWLMRSIASLVHQGRGSLPDLDARLDEMAAHIARQYRSQTVDEVLVVGHSSGAMMACIVTARALALLQAQPTAPAAPTDGDAPAARAPVLSLLTLGHCSGLLSYQPAAGWYRDELRALTQAPGLHWIDFGAPPDGCCLPMSDPTGPALPPGQPGRRPKLLNPRFAQMFSPQTYQPLRRDKHRCHFQYLMASEFPCDYDFFAITGGPQTLAARFAHLPSVTHFRQYQLFGGPGW